MYHYILSERDKEKLVHNGYVYYKAGANSWACINRKCRARLQVKLNQILLEERGELHTHSPNEKRQLENSKKHVKKRIDDVSDKVTQIVDRLQEMEAAQKQPKNCNHLLSIIDNCCQSEKVEIELNFFQCMEYIDGPHVNDQILKITECRYLPEMQQLLYTHFGHFTNTSSVDQSTPLFNYCYDLVMQCRCLPPTSPTFLYVKNLATETEFRVDVDLFLSQVGANRREIRAIRYFLSRINHTFLAGAPYKRECRCFQDCSNEPIHSISNYIFQLGYLSPVYVDSPEAVELFESGKICRFGRFRDPLAFRRHYYGRQICFKSIELRKETKCGCGVIYGANNGVHSICNWMLENQLVTEEDFEYFIKMSGLKSPTICQAGRMVRATNMCTFLMTSRLFQECPEHLMEPGKLYFSHCVRVRPDVQGAIICRTKNRIVYGLTMFQGMEQRVHYLYKGNQNAVKKLLAKMEPMLLGIELDVSKVGPSISKQCF